MLCELLLYGSSKLNMLVNRHLVEVTLQFIQGTKDFPNRSFKTQQQQHLIFNNSFMLPLTYKLKQKLSGVRCFLYRDTFSCTFLFSSSLYCYALFFFRFVDIQFFHCKLIAKFL